MDDTNCWKLHAEDDGGWFTYETTPRIGAEIWARLANVQYRWVPDFRHALRYRGVERLREWAAILLEMARFDEGDSAPRAKVELGEESTTLGWEGTFTAGREVNVQVFPDAGVAYVRYNTGTGAPSTFLGGIFEEVVQEANGVAPNAMARGILDALATAYGGRSQFGVAEVVEAVCGHVRNGVLLRGEKSVAVAVVSAALLQEEERWGDQPTPTSEEWLGIHRDAEEKVGGCWEKQRQGHGARSSGAPTGTMRAPAIVD